MLKTWQITWSLFSIFRLSQLRRRDSSNTNTPSNVIILHFYINWTCIICKVNDNALFDIVLCFSGKAKERSQIRFCFINFSELVTRYHNINWYQYHVDKTIRMKWIVGHLGLEFNGNYQCGMKFKLSQMYFLFYAFSGFFKRKYNLWSH